MLSIAGYAAIAPIPVIFDVPSRYFSVPLRAVIFLATAFVIVRRLLAWPAFRFTWFWLLFWSFWLLWSARVIVDGILNPSVLRLAAAEYLMMGIGMCALPALAVAIAGRKAALNSALAWLWMLGAFALGANIWLIARELDSGGLPALFVSRQFTETLNPISLGALGASLVLSSIWSYVHQRPGSYLFKSMRAVALVMGSAAIIAGASRGPMVAVVIVAPLIFLSRVRLRRPGARIFRLALLAGLGGLLLIAGALFVDIESMALFRRVDRGLFEDSARIHLYKEGWNLLARHPFLGAGVEPLGWYPHNLLLESFLLNGVVSGVIFFLMFSYVVIKAVYAVLMGVSSAWIPLLFLQYAVGSLFSFAIYSSVPFWVLMTAVVAMCDSSGGSIAPARSNCRTI